jgi:hypothetical protein
MSRRVLVWLPELVALFFVIASSSLVACVPGVVAFVFFFLVHAVSAPPDFSDRGQTEAVFDDVVMFRLRWGLWQLQSTCPNHDMFVFDCLCLNFFFFFFFFFLLIACEQEESSGGCRSSSRWSSLLFAPCTLCRYSVSTISSPPPPSGQQRWAWVGGLLRRSLSCRCTLQSSSEMSSRLSMVVSCEAESSVLRRVERRRCRPFAFITDVAVQLSAAIANV